MNAPLLSIVVPTFREAGNIRELGLRIDNSIKSAGFSYEIIIVDDDSNDGIAEIVDALKPSLNIRLIIRKGVKGLSSAVIEGIKQSNGGIIVVMDADLSHSPEKLPELVAPIINGNVEFTVGSRFVEGGSAPHFNSYRKLNAWVSKMLARPLTEIKDPMSGYFAFARNIIRDINILNPVGFKIGLEIIVKARPEKVAEIPIEFKERFSGESKLNIKEQLNYLVHLHRLYKFKFTHLMQMFEFALIGSLGMIIDLFIVYMTYGILSMNFRIARACGFTLALTFNFILNRKITFKSNGNGRILKQYAGFFIVCLLGLAVNWTISVMLFENVRFFNSHYLISSILGVAGGFLVNFNGCKYFVFKSR